MDTRDAISAPEYLQQQEELETAARESFPHDPRECTYAKGPLRQELYACQTCLKRTGVLNAVCYACSIRCHTSHELVELFTKRNRTCDCGTERIGTPCLVRNPQWSNLMLDKSFGGKFSPDIPDFGNKYGHNFRGRFCSCDEPYNPLEDSNMIQCILGVECDEDWYHEECLMGLKPGIIKRSPAHCDSDQGGNRLDDLDQLKPGDDAANTLQVNDNSISGDEILPLPGFPPLETFETIICWKCSSKFPEATDDLVQLLHCDTLEYIPSESLDERIKTLKPGNNKKRTKRSYPTTIFLRENYKEILKENVRNHPEGTLARFLKKYPFMYEEDPIYSPPEDDDSSSVFELGIKELNTLPPEQTIQGLEAYQKIKSKLTEFLTPFAREGRIVTKDEVKNFFNNIKK